MNRCSSGFSWRSLSVITILHFATCQCCCKMQCDLVFEFFAIELRMSYYMLTIAIFVLFVTICEIILFKLLKCSPSGSLTFKKQVKVRSYNVAEYVFVVGWLFNELQDGEKWWIISNRFCVVHQRGIHTRIRTCGHTL